MSVKTTRIAHVSDLHLLEPNPDGSRSYGFDVRFVSLGRKLDPRGRMRKVTRALDAVRRLPPHRGSFARRTGGQVSIALDGEGHGHLIQDDLRVRR